ncbi:peptidoglycan-binding domain-containing protein [Streptacidiphilus anmyonensis]|uniref:peptidoglycan-binding domain-containing protein n=1 Tax=Streptacidiphilus anmyonensis TaxID=405782 RepID=UPI00069474C8|nr:peptidoglycan-binding domain-containing protein [Streptacidiphilus anmyonensis]
MSFKTKTTGVIAAAALAGSALVALAGTASASPSAPWIGYGQSNTYNGVRCVQQELNYWIGRNTATKPAPYGYLSVDGSFGPKTDATVRWFQGQLNDSQDGIVGPQTGSQLLLNGDGNSVCYANIPSTF